jgi:glutamate--cysteine ligase
MNNITADFDFPIAGFEDLEASTQFIIAEAIRRGVKVEVLCRRENFLRLSRDGVREYVKQATRTSKDSYITSIILEDKNISKMLLKEVGIAVPEGELFESIEAAEVSFKKFSHMGVVVKPVDTNSGIGITLLPANDEPQLFSTAIREAFSHSKGILVERLVPGKEYRFLVIDDRLIAVAHRRPANVIGDGESTVEQLVAQKNSDPRRGEAYKAPLQSLRLGEVEIANLREAGLDLSSVPVSGQEVYLRKNSNLSTGGDSIDMTEEVHEGYREIAIRASQVADAKICGVDIMISDVHQAPTPANYAIIELNYNPGLRAHRYPFTGTPRRIECPILDLLGFSEKS